MLASIRSVRSPSEAAYMSPPVLCPCSSQCNINHMTIPNQFVPSLMGKAKTLLYVLTGARNKVVRYFWDEAR
jgi:hypothetical protein